MSEPKDTDLEKDIEAVRRLRSFFRESPELVWKYCASDEGFIWWVADVLKIIRAEDMAQVKKLLENDPESTQRKADDQCLKQIHSGLKTP